MEGTDNIGVAILGFIVLCILGMVALAIYFWKSTLLIVGVLLLCAAISFICWAVGATTIKIAKSLLPPLEEEEEKEEGNG